MARPNEGKTANSVSVKIWIDKKFAEKMSEAMINLRDELYLRQDRKKLDKTPASDWQIKMVYEPKSRKKQQ